MNEFLAGAALFGLSVCITTDAFAEALTADKPDSPKLVTLATAEKSEAAINVQYFNAPSTNSVSIGVENYWPSNGWFALADLTVETYKDDAFESTNNIFFEIQKEMVYPWLVAANVSHWDGADAVSTNQYELRLTRFAMRSDVSVIAGLNRMQLTGAGVQGRAIKRHYETSFFGIEVRYFLVESMSFSASFIDYAHNFNPASLDIERRPILELILSPDTIGVISGLTEHSVAFNASYTTERWTWGANLAIYESTVDNKRSNSQAMYADFQWRNYLSISAEVGQQVTESYPSSTYSGIGARFSW